MHHLISSSQFPAERAPILIPIHTLRGGGGEAQGLVPHGTAGKLQSQDLNPGSLALKASL